MPEHRRPFWKRHFRAILWGIAIAGLLVTILTGFRFTLIFLPLVFAPGWFGTWNDSHDD